MATASSGLTADQVLTAAKFAGGLYRERAAVWWSARVRGDLFSRLQSGSTDPYPTYAQMRRTGALLPTRLGNWSTTSHMLCNQILRSRDFGVDDPVAPRPRTEDFDLSLLDRDPPDHTRLRRLANPAFSPRQMRGYAPMIESTMHRLLDRSGPRDELDFVTDVAAPLPIAVITTLLGVAYDDEEEFRRYGASIGGALDGLRSLRHAREVLTARTALNRMLDELIERRRTDPGEDVISLLVAELGDQLSITELAPMALLLLVAGFETTVNLLGNAVLALVGHPEQWELLRAEPHRAADVVDEVLRYDPPVHQTARVAHRDTEIGGQTITHGRWVITLLGATGRDPEVYLDPDVFDITRTPEKEHLAFSSGVHYCLGAPLARLEATIALRVLAERATALRVVGKVVPRRSRTIRGPASLPIALT